ncbi:MAG: 5-oxoprolinase subunit PxpB [Chloroflexi bacterium]|nr:5-oxoprolinase subunit PxpB [Chloroflexota bacterium]
MYEKTRVLLAGDKAVLIEFGNSISPEINRKVHNMCIAIKQARISGITEVVPTYRSALVYYDPMKMSPDELKAKLFDLERELGTAKFPRPKVVEIPTVYGGEYGPDLEFVAQHNKLDPEEVIRIHTSTDYLVYMLGFTPGFPYLGGMSPKIATPRLETPRTKIPAGSVGIAGNQTGIYSIDSPGGWRLIGRTPLKLFDPTKDPPVAIEAGNLLRFVKIDEKEFLEIRRAVEASNYRVKTFEAG